VREADDLNAELTLVLAFDGHLLHLRFFDVCAYTVCQQAGDPNADLLTWEITVDPPDDDDPGDTFTFRAEFSGDSGIIEIGGCRGFGFTEEKPPSKSDLSLRRRTSP
jgi:hypothetical protein